MQYKLCGMKPGGQRYSTPPPPPGVTGGNGEARLIMKQIKQVAFTNFF